MTKMVDMLAMRQRVKATEARLNSATQEEGRRNARLLDLLNVIEKDLTLKQERIKHLEEEKKQLTGLLHDVLTLVENVEERRSQLAGADLEQQIQRLETMPCRMNHDAHENVLELTQPEPISGGSGYSKSNCRRSGVKQKRSITRRLVSE